MYKYTLFIQEWDTGTSYKWFEKKKKNTKEF